MDEIYKKYIEKFNELPVMPLMVNRGLIKSLMEEAINRGTPVTQEEINAKVKTIKEPIDIDIFDTDEEDD